MGSPRRRPDTTLSTLRDRFCRPIRLTTGSIVATLRRGTEEVVTVLGSGQPADDRDDDLELADDYDPELGRFDELCDRDED